MNNTIMGADETAADSSESSLEQQQIMQRKQTPKRTTSHDSSSVAVDATNDRIAETRSRDEEIMEEEKELKLARPSSAAGTPTLSDASSGEDLDIVVAPQEGRVMPSLVAPFPATDNTNNNNVVVGTVVGTSATPFDTTDYTDNHNNTTTNNNNNDEKKADEEMALMAPTSSANKDTPTENAFQNKSILKPPNSVRFSDKDVVIRQERRTLLLSDDVEGGGGGDEEETVEQQRQQHKEELGYYEPNGSGRLEGYHEAHENDNGEDYDDRNSDMDDARVPLRRRLSKLERLQEEQSKLSLKIDEREEKFLPQDTFSFLVVAEMGSFPYMTALVIFALQLTTFVLVLLDMADNGSPGNVFGVPANVSPQLRTTQFIAVLVAVLTQGDLRTAFSLLRDGYCPGIHEAFEHISSFKFRTSIFARAMSGSTGLVVSFVLVVTAPSVVELLLNFTAIEFVSSIDELCFFLSKQGFLGSRCKTFAMNIARTLFKVPPESRMGCFRRSWKTGSLFVILAIFLTGWIITVYFQSSGLYQCETVMVQMSDDFVAALGAFNGLYDLRSPARYVPFSEQRVQYIERRSEEIVPLGRGVFGYCNDISAWTFRWEFYDGGGYSSDSDANCDWVARSAETATYDITETLSEDWFVRDESMREVLLDPFRLMCFTCESGGQEGSDACAGHGVCNNAVCECEDGFFGLRCEFTTPCSTLAIDARTDDFASTRDWATDFQTIKMENAGLVTAYHRPVYVHDYDDGLYDVIMFTGRRWALTSSEFLPRGGKISDEELQALSQNHQGVGNEIGNFFHFIYHGYQGYFEESYVAFLSEFMDAMTDTDSSEPVGLDWFHAVGEERTGENENQSPKREVDTELVCRVCNDGSNICLYDGVCVEGSCQCSLDSFGSLCENPPVKNGHCDPFFNTPEFKYDGGDCCELTCVSTDKYVCGAEGEGFVSTGYPDCHFSGDNWQAYSLNGKAGSYAGFDLDLSMRTLAVGELFQDRVRIFDKQGSSWVLRDTIIGAPGSRFGKVVAISAGPHNVVSNPSFVAPLTLAIADGFRKLRVYRCDTEGCVLSQEVDLVHTFDLSGDGSVLATSLFSTVAPPSQIIVYQANGTGFFEPRADFNITKGGLLYNPFSMKLNGNGSVFVIQNQRLEIDPERGFPITQEEYVDVRTWNGASYDIADTFLLKAGFNTYAFPISLDVSQDGNVLAYGVPSCQDYDFQFHVYKRDEAGVWSMRNAPSFDLTDCKKSDRPDENNNLALSRDGSMLAFRLGVAVNTFRWEFSQWSRVEGLKSTINYPISLSADGTELAVGSPEEGIGGISNVYSLPGTKQCPKNSSLLRISITLDRLPLDLTWDLKNTETGEYLYERGPYPTEYAFGTLLEETCIASDSCFELSIYNKRQLGLQAPGQYALFLDGEDIGRGTFGGLVETVSIGSCAPCQNGTEPFRMFTWTCGPVQWGIFQLVDNGLGTNTPLVNGSTVETAPDQDVYSSCNAHNGRLTCNNPVRQAYNACLDPNECYGFNIVSPNLNIALTQLRLGSEIVQTDPVQTCSRSTAQIGNKGKCFTEDFGTP